MARREEIENNIGYKITKAAMEYYQTNCANDVDLSEAFEEGAEWMQKVLIDKACQWIESYLFDIGFPDDWCRDSATMKSGKQRFLEAMEE